MAIIDILLRTVTHADLSTKNAVITWEEEDQNFIEIYEALKSLMNVDVTLFEPYNAGTTYESGDYVSYNGNIYRFINVTPTSGITPGSDPLYWEIASVGEFAHEKNKDQYLDFGGPNQVSAEDLYDLLNGGLGDFFENGGNSFGATARIGTKDAQDLVFVTGVGPIDRGSILKTGEFVFGATAKFSSTYFSVKSPGTDSTTYAQQWYNTAGTPVKLAWVRDDGSFNFKTGKLFVDDTQYSNLTPSNNNVGIGPMALDTYSGLTGSNVALGDRAGSTNSMNYSMMMGTLTGQGGSGDYNFYAILEAGKSATSTHSIGIGSSALLSNSMDRVKGLGDDAARSNNTYQNAFVVSRITSVFWNNIGDKGFADLGEVKIQTAMSPDGTDSSAVLSVQAICSALATGSGLSGDIVFKYAATLGSGTTRQSHSESARMIGPSGLWKFSKSVGVGILPTVNLHTVSTTEQFRAGYDSTNYMSVTVGATGNANFDLTGTSPLFSFSKSVGIGTQTPISPFHIVSQSSTSFAHTLFIDLYEGSATPPIVGFRKARGTVSSPTKALTTDGLLFISARGYTTDAGFTSGANGAIAIVAAEDYTSSSSTGNFFQVELTAIGSSTRLARMAVDGYGKMSIGTNAPAAILDINNATVSLPAWTINGAGIRKRATAYTDTTSAAGTVSEVYGNFYASDTINSTNAVTYTTAYANVFGTMTGTGNATVTNSRSALFLGSIEVRGTAINVKAGAAAFIGTIDANTYSIRTNAVSRLTFGSSGGLTVVDANDLSFGTTTGSKIGTATTQKIGFWNATPIVQPTTAVAASTFVANTSGIVNDTATFDGYTIGQVVKALRNMGILA